MNLKTKPRNILKANQINTLQNLSSYTRKELLLFNGFGSNSVKSIERILGLYGLQLKH